MNYLVIIEDNITLNKAFVEIINSSENYRVVNSYYNCEDALANLKDDDPDIVLMDVQLPGMNGVQGTRIIKKTKPDVNVIMITVYENSETVFNALCAGASGYLTKNTSSDELVQALDELVNGGAPMSIHIAKMVVSSFKKNIHTDLSEREIQVLTLLSKGKSYRSIGNTLFISINTIKFHIKNIYGKLQVRTREEAIRKASNSNII